jgi:hypothetical protein
MSEMNPEQPQPMSMSQPPEGGVPAGPFKGDKMYAIGDFLALIIGTGINIFKMPEVAAEALKKAQENAKPGAQAPTAEMIQMFMTIGTGCVVVVSLAISIFLWINMIKGRKWAFIVSIVLIVLGIGLGALGLAGAGAIGAMFGMAVGVVKLAYCVMRMVGKVGPTLI